MSYTGKVKFYRTDIYHPPSKALELYIKHNHLDKFMVDFNECSHVRGIVLNKLSDMVCDTIARLPVMAQELESERFFIYLLQDPRQDLREYLLPLLNYFHILGFLKFKKHIYNNNKQSVVRYQVTFKNKEGKVIAHKKYSSLQQLSDDTGKKMSSLHYQLFKT
jgi:hypothetical protein